MKNNIFVLVALLIATVSCQLTAKELVVDKHLRVQTPNFKHQWTVTNRVTNAIERPVPAVKFECIDVLGKYKLTACFSGANFYTAADAQFFWKYGSLSEENRAHFERQPNNSLVFGGGTPPWFYSTNEIQVGDFIAAEADNVLCHTPSAPTTASNVCYVAAVRMRQPELKSFALIVSSEISGQSKKDEQIKWIREFIKSINVIHTH
jgi:hypothetical protein